MIKGNINVAGHCGLLPDSTKIAYAIVKTLVQDTPNPHQIAKETASPPRLKSRRVTIIVGVAVLGLLLIALGTFFAFKNYSIVHKSTNKSAQPSNKQVTAIDPALQAGQELSSGKCNGSGAGKLTVPAMNPADFSILIPYGLVVGGHVTPIDHQYWAPANYNSPLNAYPVFAMGDAHITDIEPRTHADPTNPTKSYTEYRLVFTHSCTWLYYYDLVTSLSPDIKAIYDKHGGFDIPVKAGQMIGRIGHQTLDFAVWDTTKPLKGFINPTSYKSEAWKIYTANPLNYMSASLKALVIARDPRTAEPIEGKIDYDLDGKLIGNWFVKGTGGYSGGVSSGQPNYWKTHLSIVPNLYDPSAFILSIGSWQTSNGQLADQFAAKGNAPDPSTVSVATGLVRYNLVKFNYTAQDGTPWTQMNVIKNPKLQLQVQIEGCALVQLTGDRALKFEAIQGKSCASINGFSANAKAYER